MNQVVAEARDQGPFSPALNPQTAVLCRQAIIEYSWLKHDGRWRNRGFFAGGLGSMVQTCLVKIQVVPDRTTRLGLAPIMDRPARSCVRSLALLYSDIGVPNIH